MRNGALQGLTVSSIGQRRLHPFQNLSTHDQLLDRKVPECQLFEPMHSVLTLILILQKRVSDGCETSLHLKKRGGMVVVISFFLN